MENYYMLNMLDLSLLNITQQTWESFPTQLAANTDSMTWILAADTSLLQAWGNRLYNILLMLLGLGFVIFVHELGHFLAAKMFGVKCEKFYLGFDVPIKIGPIRLPSKLAKFQWGETEYGIGIVPLGGYVKMLGQDDDPRNLKEENQRIRTGTDAESNAGLSEDARPKLDPRSYPAKPVFARMIIISAGVIMNLIFGVLMAACAFRLGVPYTPAVLGNAIPGDPAWKAGLRGGDRIVGIESSQDEQMFYDEIRKKVAIHGIRKSETPLTVEFDRHGERKSVKLSGTMVHADPSARINFQTIGIRPTSTTQLSDKNVFDRVLEADNINLGPLEPGDVVLGVDGVMLEEGSAEQSGSAGGRSDSDARFLGYQLDELLHPRLNRRVELSVERRKGDQKAIVSVPLDPLPYKTLGLRFEPDTVTVVAEGTPAEATGVRMGDKLTKFNDEPIEDAITLPNRVATFAGQKVKLQLTRTNSDDSPIEFEWTVPTRFQLENDLPIFGNVGMELPGSGLVYNVSRIISGVVPGSVAEQSGLKAGDQLQQVQYGKASESQEKYLKLIKIESEFAKQTPIDGLRNLSYLQGFVQMLPLGLPMKVYVERNGKLESGTVAVMNDPDAFSPQRHLVLSPFRKTFVASSWTQALQRGVSEIRRGIGDVLEFLQLIVTGKAFNYIGGPGTIAMQATSAASQGISPLLMFLTLLSANLAVVNFLPVPALDGGHMVFLAAEAITGKPVNEELQAKLTIGGIIALLCLMILAFRNDILFFMGTLI